MTQVAPPRRDTGYFGPDSVSWRVHHDPAALVGGLRALALQSLHPGVMRGFEAVTSVRDDPWGRLGRTASYVDVVVHGTRSEADEAAARVRRVHASLGLDRPEWLLWVHAAAVDSWLTAHRRSGAAMSDDEADRYVAEQVVAAELVGLDAAMVPSDVAGLATALAGYRSVLEVTAQARDAVLGLLWPPMPPRVQWTTPARPVWTWAATTAVGLLPRWARRMFALPGLPTTDVTATLSARALRATLLLVPESRRTSPARAAALADVA